MKKVEKVLLYHFQDREKLRAIQSVLSSLHIVVEELPEDSYEQKVGFLLGAGGFSPAKDSDDQDPFVFPFEVMVYYNIRNKRLSEVLDALRKANIPSVRFKAVVTPFNMFWSLRRLCETMQKEHAAIKNEDE